MPWYDHIELEIVTAERLVYTDTVDMVVAPGEDGELGILPNHTALLAALGPGELRLKKGGVEEYFAIGGGFMEVRNGTVTVMADAAAQAEEIDIARAEEARRQAEATLRAGPPREERAALESTLRHSLTQLRVARRRRHEMGGPRRETGG